MCRLFGSAILAALVWTASQTPPAAAQGEKASSAKEASERVIEGSLRGVTRGVLVTKQIKTAKQNWKRLYEKETDVHETANFLLLGSVPGKTLQEIGETLEKQLAVARKVLQLEREDPWAGKLAVYLLAERGRYNTFVRGVQRRRVEEDELGCHEVLKSEVPHVGATAGSNPLDPSVEDQAGEQMAAAALTQKVGTETVPEWVLAGFGRATTFQAAPLAKLSAEHKRAQQLLFAKKYSSKDVYGAGLSAEEATILRASLIEYLAFSGRTAKFLPFLKGFQPTENVAEPTTEMALNVANLGADKLTEFWYKWAKTTK